IIVVMLKLLTRYPAASSGRAHDGQVEGGFWGRVGQPFPELLGPSVSSPIPPCGRDWHVLACSLVRHLLPLHKSEDGASHRWPRGRGGDDHLEMPCPGSSSRRTSSWRVATSTYCWTYAAGTT